jgi:hypothetical protein
MKTYAKIGQIQWLLFWMSLVDQKFLIVWIFSLFMENKK